ncbi:MAG: nitroreductase family protein [Gammaproteobacteria bacterium]|nr:nitroreductase family protein [Gammaproteobacteria bacterium]
MMRNPVDHDVQNVFRKRWSPYAYDPDRDVSSEQLKSLFEAARWAMSSFNAQPWRYIVGVKGRSDDIWKGVYETLVDGNREWARNAPVLALGLAELNYEHNGKPNRHAAHDLGAASASLALEAAARGLAVHQMGGFSGDRARELFDLPDGVEPYTAMAIGYPAERGTGEGELEKRDSKPRQRKALNELVIRGGF